MGTTVIRRWSKIWTPAFVALSTLMLLAGTPALVDDSDDWQGWLPFVLYAVAGFVLAASCWREGMRVDDAGLTLHRTTGSERLAWDEVADVSASGQGRIWPTWRVVRRDGRVVDSHIRRSSNDVPMAVALHRPASPPAGHD